MSVQAVSLPSDRSLPLLFGLLLVACATRQAIQDLPRSGDVAMTPVPAAEEQRYAVASDTKWDMPTPFAENGAPVYPPELLAARLPPVKVRVRVIVNEEGIVTDSTALEVPSDYPQFFASVQAVVGGWKFWPLVKWVPVEGGRTDIEFSGFVSTYWGDATALPFHQDYEFTFTQKDGEGEVSSAAPASGN